MNRVVLLAALFMVMASIVAGQAGPQVLYPGSFQVVPGTNIPGRYELAARAKSSSDPNPVTPVDKGTYRPAREVTIRELIKMNRGVDPVYSDAPNYVDRFLTNRLVLAAKLGRDKDRVGTQYSSPDMRPEPTAREMAGLAGDNVATAPYGLGRDPLGMEFNPMRSGPANPNFQPQSQFLPFVHNPQPHSPGPFAVYPHPGMTTGIPKKNDDPAAKEDAVFMELEAQVTPIPDALASELDDLVTSYDAKQALRKAKKDVSVALAETSSRVVTVKRLPDHIRAAIDARDRAHNKLQFPEDVLASKAPRGDAPVIVKKLGGEPLSLIQQREAAQAAANAKAEADAAIAAAEQAKKDALEAAQREQAEILRQEQELKDQQAALAAEEEAKAKEEATLAAMLASQESEQSESLIQSQSKVNTEVNAEAELEALAEAVAQDTMKTQEELVSKSMAKLKTKIEKAATEAAAEATLPWWQRKSGVEGNNKNAKQSQQQSMQIKSDVPTATLLEAFTSTKTEVETEEEGELDAEAEAEEEDIALVETDAEEELEEEEAVPKKQVSAPGYGGIKSLAEISGPSASLAESTATTTATAAATDAPTGPMYHAYPPHSGQAVIKVQRQANPYAFTSMDLLYPKLRRVWGLSGFPAGVQETVLDGGRQGPANTQDPAGVNYNGNPAAIGVAPGAPQPHVAAPVAPAPAAMPSNIVINLQGAGAAIPTPVSTTTTAAAFARNNNPESVYYPNALPQAGPYQTYFPGSYTPPPSHMIHAGNPTPGTQLSDNGSFGSLKV